MKKPAHRGTTAGKKHYSPIPAITTSWSTTQKRYELTTSLRQSECDPSNLISVKTTTADPNVRPQVHFCLINARSVKNKNTTIYQFIVDNDIDILVITETWLHPGDADRHVINALTPPGYTVKHVARDTGYVGVAIVYKASLPLTPKEDEPTGSNFECLCVDIPSAYGTDKLCAVYRPPPNSKNKFTTKDFTDQFEIFVDSFSVESGRLFIAGDFNFHIDDPQNQEACKLKKLLKSQSLKQHVRGSTHDRGHTLDLFITRNSDKVNLKPSVEVTGFSDHSAVHLRLPLFKPPLQRKEIIYRKLRSIDNESFKADLKASSLVSCAPKHLDIDDLVST